MSEDWTPILAMGTLLSAVFIGLGTLKQITARLVTELKELTVCPNCGQPFDVSHFPIVDGIRTVSCPRCSETFRV